MGARKLKLGIAVAAALLLFLASNSSFFAALLSCPDRVYLNDKAVSGGGGKNWETAYNNFEPAFHEASRLAATGHPAGLWIASGNYLIDPVTVPGNLQIYGGFKGSESDPSERAPFLTATNATVLSARQPDRDLITISGVSNILINGLVISSISNSTGGATALKLVDCNESIVFQHCRVAGNINRDGGAAMQLSNASPLLVYCQFSENRALGQDAAGGALRITGSSAPQFFYATFNRNSSESGKGGAVVFSGTSENPFLLNECHLIANRAASGASALYVKEATGSVKMINCVTALNRITESGNTNAAGAVHLEGQSSGFVNFEVTGDETSLTDNWRLHQPDLYVFTPSLTWTNANVTTNGKVNMDHLKRLVEGVLTNKAYFNARSDKKEFRRYLHNLPMLNEAPGPGKKVLFQFDEYLGTAVYHFLYLPPDWKPGNRYPVIMDIPGNPFNHQWGDFSTGRPESSPIGYGVSEGNAICIGLPCIGLDGQSHVPQMGDVPVTLAYMKQVAVWVCENWGGDPARMVLAGYSRGGLGTSFLGRYDDEMADVWLAWLHYDGFDQPYGPEIQLRKSSYNTAADDWEVAGGIMRRFVRIKGRTTCIVGSGYNGAFQSYNTAHNFPYAFFSSPGRNHNPIWSIAETEVGRQVQEWYRNTLRVMPGTGSLSGTLTDGFGRPLAGIRIQTGLTRFSYSNEKGFFILEGLPAGARTVTMARDGTVFSTTNVVITSGVNATLNWQVN